jgi:hypothetical protein
VAACDLRIVLDKADRLFTSDDKISGSVEVRVNSDCAPKRFTMTWEWRTHGKGNPTKGRVREIEFPSRAWKRGEQFSHRFSLSAPRRPFTYHGEYLNVDWYLSAQVDLPWASDPKTEEEALVVPRPGSGTPNLGPEFRPHASNQRPNFWSRRGRASFQYALVQCLPSLHLLWSPGAP